MDGDGAAYCDGCDVELSKKLNSMFNFYVLNLDRRDDKLKCVEKQFRSHGIKVHRLRGLDASQLPIKSLSLIPNTVKRYLQSMGTRSGMWGACMVMSTFCSTQRSPAEVAWRRIQTFIPMVESLPPTLSLIITNAVSGEVDVFRVDKYGMEHLMMSVAEKGAKKLRNVAVGSAWRIRQQGSLLMEFQLWLNSGDDGGVSGADALYFLNKDSSEATVRVVGCADSQRLREKISIFFEDDVVLREDFGEKLLWSFQEMQKGRVDWDVFLLNWYCNTVHWKECKKIKDFEWVASRPWTKADQRMYAYTDSKQLARRYGVSRARFYMSGSAYAVTASSARKLLKTFPCNPSLGVCSMAIDWHISMMQQQGKVNVYGAVPPFVLMPDMGHIQPLGISPPHNEDLHVCGEYRSDTHTGEEDRGRAKVIEERWQTATDVPSADYQQGLKVSTSSGKYFVHRRSLTWKTAARECRRLHGETGRLASVPSLEINGKITESVEGLCGNFSSVLDGWDLCAWIGLNDYALEGQFIWDSTMVATPRFSQFPAWRTQQHG